MLDSETQAVALAVTLPPGVTSNESNCLEDEDTEIGAGSPEGCSITILTEAGETEEIWRKREDMSRLIRDMPHQMHQRSLSHGQDKVFLEELEGQGHVVSH